MDKDKAFNLACDLMVKHVGDGLFRWSKSKRCFGEATMMGDTPTLILSSEFVERNNSFVVYECILHEIAHLLTWGEGHNDIWKAKCIEIGLLKPERYCSPYVIKPKYTYKLFCSTCNETLTGWYRKPKQAIYECKECKQICEIVNG